jgi:hypothetical protein
MQRLKSATRQSSHHCVFTLLGSTPAKVGRKMFVEWTHSPTSFSTKRPMYVFENVIFIIMKKKKIEKKKLLRKRPIDVIF